MKIIRPLTITDAVLTASNVTDTVNNWASGTTYGIGDRVNRVTTDIHRIYECVQGHTNHDPLTDTAEAYWVFVGGTNRWKMFDGSVQSDTQNSDSIAVTFTLGSTDRIDSIALFNLSASSVHITLTDATDGLVYDQTVELVSDSGITDWYSYWFEPIIRKTTAVLTGLPPYSGAAVGATITDTGATAKCGECVIGLSRDVGTTQDGLRVGIKDFSTKQTDDFGNYQILERAYSKRVDVIVWVLNGLISTLADLLAEFRATPVVYVVSDVYDAAVVYGFYSDFGIVIAGAEMSQCSIQLEGLT